MSLTTDYFIDKDILLYQDDAHFRFNTDTKLLAQFTRLKKQERVLDIGTTSGVLLVYFDQFGVKELVGVTSKMTYRHLGRIEENLTLEDLILHANRLLKSYGRFYFVHRPNRFHEIYVVLLRYHFHVRNLQFVYDQRNNVVKSVLVEAIKESNCDANILPPIYI